MAERPDPMERERILVRAAEQYVRGEISLEEHNRIRDAHRIDYRKAIEALHRSGRRWWQFWRW